MFRLLSSIVHSVAVLSIVLSTQAFAAPTQRLIDRGDGKVFWASQDEIQQISKAAHLSGKCGGYFDLTDEFYSGLPKVSSQPLSAVEAFTLSLDDRPMTQGAYLAQALPQVDHLRLKETVKNLSNMKNRYYQSAHGAKAAEWIAGQFKNIAKGRSDITVELFNHTSWKQPSVIATIKGQGPKANEIVVIGGHEDSINQSAIFGGEEASAPGADDNATGTATVLEVFRILVETQFKPNRTLQFMTYAAEEVGLRGSQAIANEYKRTSKVVVAAAQFDMTGFPGTGDQVVFMTDFVNPELTQFTQKLLDTYVKVKWITDRCGYACSDHASWTKAGYPSVMPFESKMASYNSSIHTAQDLMEKLDWMHSLHYAKLGVAFMSELSQ